MIKIIDKTRKLKENKNSLLDQNSFYNEILVDILNEKINTLKKISEIHNATVLIEGDINNLSFKVNSESNDSVDIIENLLKK